MKIVFFGSSKYSRIAAQTIHQSIPLTAIVTLPDRPNKKGILLPSPLTLFAKEHTIPVITENKITHDVIEKVAALKPDFLVVADYGLILPKKLLDVPTFTCLNIHHSLLPKYRGPSPAPSAILAGEKISGVTVIKMAEKVDAGDILAQKDYPLQPNETTDSLLTMLNRLGGEIILPVITNYATNTAPAQSQLENKATYTRQFTKQDGYFDITNPPTKEKLDRMIRAFFPWPTVWTKINVKGQEKIIKFLPGDKIQMEGKNPVSMKDFINGYPELKNLVNLFDE